MKQRDKDKLKIMVHGEHIEISKGLNSIVVYELFNRYILFISIEGSTPKYNSSFSIGNKEHMIRHIDSTLKLCEGI